ncbi:MAG TPA: hypothetical protein VHM90_08140, partial [Phycisphaerae bacterium]|nr:hypothetical protein [Phycisphaerae bacterium]
MFGYINLIYWFLALAGLIAWIRFAVFMCDDITRNLVDQPELPWKLGSAGVFAVMFLIFLVMPNFWISFPINLVIAGSVVGAF